MTRSTSREALAYIESSGILGKRRTQAYRFLFDHGPMTANELSQHAGNLSGLWKRLSELRSMGMVREMGERKCAITGRQAILWDVTEKLPAGSYSAPTKKPPLSELRDRVEQLERENATLRRQITNQPIQQPLFADNRKRHDLL